MMSKVDELLKKVELFEKLAVYGDRKSFLQALAQSPLDESFNQKAFEDAADKALEYEPTPAYVPRLPNVPTENVVNLPEVNISGKAPAQYPSVPKDIQQSLGFEGAQVDGVLGPETRRRLDAQKLYFKLPAGTPDAELFKKIRGQNITREVPV
jgi:hypothetical protein